MNGIMPTLNFAAISQTEVEPDRCPAVRAYPKQTRQTLEHCPTLTDAGWLAVHRPAAEVIQRAMLLQPFDGGGQQGDAHPPPQALEDGLGIIVPADDEDWTAVPVELPPHPGQEVADAGHDAFTVTVSGSVIEVTGVTTGRFLPFGAGPALGMGSGHRRTPTSSRSCPTGHAPPAG